MKTARTVYLVGGDLEYRRSLARALRAAGYRTHAFANAADTMEATDYIEPGCVLLDTRLPDEDGMVLLRRLGELRAEMPVIVIDQAASVRSAVRAIQAGAVDVLEHPFDDAVLLAMLDQAFAELPARIRHELRVREAVLRSGRLTPREREVLHGMLGGLSSREIGGVIGIGIRTVEMHRANVMRKLDTDSLPGLMRLCLLAGLTSVDDEEAAA
ncbi:response regulator transcription factor [Sphingomonas sp. CGMCC 1.13654]|uniref:Response regulator transcription factor n=1 Tax=Sphingomonas chungangi TaxID=2683589 RepID=A0A838LEN7_9SPHN|nr:response regulator [Sphingomonas chungangi]MBA2935918.1 response regulator transcription factor [Sphingomonas chungangi]MVW54609.1 response regulator [Sphingomonas chungangi]